MGRVVAVSAALTVAAAAALSRRRDKSTDQQKAGIYKFSTLFSVPLRPTLFIWLYDKVNPTFCQNTFVVSLPS